MSFQDGARYKARAFGQVVLGTSAEKKTPFIELYFRVTEGETQGGEVRWTGYFGERSAARTIESLQFCGWEGDDLGEFADGELHGLDTNEVEIVVQLEEYEKDGEKRVTPRVRWINKLGGFLNVQNAMSKDEAKSFGERMKGLVLKTKAKKSPAEQREESDSFDFGANVREPPKSEPKATGTGRRRF